MNDRPTPETNRIMENFHIAMHADTYEQSIAHSEEVHREVERLERERDEARTQILALREALAQIERLVKQVRHSDECYEVLDCICGATEALATHEAHKQSLKP